MQPIREKLFDHRILIMAELWLDKIFLLNVIFALLKLVKYWLNITSDKKYPLRICSDIKQDKG